MLDIKMRKVRKTQACYPANQAIRSTMFAFDSAIFMVRADALHRVPVGASEGL